MATEEQVDATCRRLQSSRRELVELARIFNSNGEAAGRAGPAATDAATNDGSHFPRSRIMRAMTGQQGKKVLGQAALALAMSRPRMAWRLAGIAPFVRPLLIRYLAQRLLRSRRPVSR